MKPDFKEILKPYQERAESALQSHRALFDSKNKLGEACWYALSQGGKRFRPALVWMVAEALNKNVDVTEAALAVEYFHTASLIADDLPCMDDEKERRGSPTTHAVFGEATALLASYALIAEGYAAIGKGNPAVLSAALEEAGRTTGLEGASGGQFLDLYPQGEDFASYQETVLKKTISLFEMSFLFGWLFAGGSLDHLEEVKRCAYHYGMAFQIADDFGDVLKDLDQGRKMNAVLLLGSSEAMKLFQKEISSYKEKLAFLGIASKELLAIADGIALPEALLKSQG